MLSVFFSSCVFRVWFGVFCRFLPFFSSKGRFLEKIFGSELLFLGVGVGLVFFGGVFAYVFDYIFGISLPKLFGKILLMSGLVFLGFVLSSFGFFVDVFLRGVFSF